MEESELFKMRGKELEPDIDKYRHFPNRKFCKAYKGHHRYEVKDIQHYAWHTFRNGKVEALKTIGRYVNLVCKCGKKHFISLSKIKLNEDQ